MNIKNKILFLILILDLSGFDFAHANLINIENYTNTINQQELKDTNLISNNIFFSGQLKNIETNPIDNRGKLPEPGTLLLFGTGFLGILSSFVRKFFKQIKRGMDICIAVSAIIVTLPLTLLIAVIIKATSKGPIFFKQERVGENKRRIEYRKTIDNNSRLETETIKNERRELRSYGRRFIMYKFRSMRADAEKQTGPVWAMENDNRITKIGKILRKSHLDELPQLINVLKGEMSIIGPRPERHVFIEKLNKEIKIYNRRLQVKPGITGLAQVRQRYDTSIEDVKKKVHYDILYIKKMCLLMDLRIMAGTFVVMLTGKGAR